MPSDEWWQQRYEELRAVCLQHRETIRHLEKLLAEYDPEFAYHKVVEEPHDDNLHRS